jgi:hypothetical protein
VITTHVVMTPAARSSNVADVLAQIQAMQASPG